MHSKYLKCMRKDFLNFISLLQSKGQVQINISQ